MDDTLDLLQIKIDKAKAELPKETLSAIETVDWKAVILGMRESKGYTFEQLGDLEIETELLLCGLINPADYPKEISERMKIGKAEADALVEEMNDRIFAKIRAELVKANERKKIFQKNLDGVRESRLPAEMSPDVPLGYDKSDTEILGSTGIKIKEQPLEISSTPPAMDREQILKKIEKPEPAEAVHPILAQKLSGSFKSEVVETEHSLENLSKAGAASPANVDTKPKIPNVDPYREKPE